MSHPIILLHGALGSKTQLVPLKKTLEERGRKVNTLNFSGHSGEPFSKDGFGIEVFVHDVIQFINDNKIESSDIFGYSMGGYVALWLAHHYPLRVNNIITLGTKFDWTPETADREVRKMDAEKIQSKAPAFARILEHRHAPNDWKELMLKTSNMMLDLGDNPMLTPEIMVTIKHKTKVLLGDQDDMADHSYSEKVTGWLPNGEFRLLHDTPHPIEKVNLEMLNNFFD